MYEVFYQTSDDNRFSGGNTSNTKLTLTGLTLGVTYWIFVVAFGEEGVPVLPSIHSQPDMIILCEFMYGISKQLYNSYYNNNNLYLNLINSTVSSSNSTITGHVITHFHFLFHYGVMELSRGVCC